jgi:hypothetical protein
MSSLLYIDRTLLLPCLARRPDYQPRGRAMRKVHKRYLREFLPATFAYSVLIIAYGFLARSVDSVFLRSVLVVLPLAPMVLMIRAMVRVIRDQDELERRIDLEAIAIASMLTGFGFFTFGMLLGASDWQGAQANVVAIWVLPCLFFSFGLAKIWVSRRYPPE